MTERLIAGSAAIAVGLAIAYAIHRARHTVGRSEGWWLP